MPTTAFYIQKYTLRHNTKGDTFTRIYLTLKSTNKTAVLIFLKDGKNLGANYIESNGRYNVYLYASRFPDFIDILRNEKPVIFEITEDLQNAMLRTTKETVGEEETVDTRRG